MDEIVLSEGVRKIIADLIAHRNSIDEKIKLVVAAIVNQVGDPNAVYDIDSDLTRLHKRM